MSPARLIDQHVHRGRGDGDCPAVGLTAHAALEVALGIEFRDQPEAGPGPLKGLRVIEIAADGPVSFAAMLLADLGADVLRIARPSSGSPATVGPEALGFLHRGRPVVTMDMKTEPGREFVLRCARAADALIEGMRPGVMERLRLGPDQVWAQNERLVYGRLTGYGQTGPLAQTAGHDLNYLAVSGVLGAMARHGEKPMFPLNLLADLGGGGLLMAFGVVCAVFESRTSGQGQLVDAAMVDGVALMSGLIHGFRTAGVWNDEPGTNFLDSGAHFYDVYRTGDGGYMAVAAIEPPFYRALLQTLGLEPTEFPQWDRQRWPQFKQCLADVFCQRTRDDWTKLFGSVEACTTPVLALAEAPHFAHNQARQVFRNGSAPQPAPAPRFSRTPGAITTPSLEGQGVTGLLQRWGISDEL